MKEAKPKLTVQYNGGAWSFTGTIVDAALDFIKEKTKAEKLLNSHRKVVVDTEAKQRAIYEKQQAESREVN